MISDKTIFMGYPICVNNLEVSIGFETSITVRYVNLIIDTGAQLSLIRRSVIRPKAIYYPNKKISLVGISGPNNCQTQGLAPAEITTFK